MQCFMSGPFAIVVDETDLVVQVDTTSDSLTVPFSDLDALVAGLQVAQRETDNA